MAHELTQLIQMRQKMQQLTDKGLMELCCFFMDTGKRTIIEGGIFRQMYSTTADSTIIATIINQCNNLLKLHAKQHNPYQTPFDTIADNIVSEITTYLDGQQILTIFSHVCRRFLQIAMKVESLKFWYLDTSLLRNVNNYKPHYPVSNILTKMQQLRHIADVSAIINVNKLSKIKKISFDNSACLIKSCIENMYIKQNMTIFDCHPQIEKIQLSEWNFEDCTLLQKLFFGHNSTNFTLDVNLKSIEFDRCQWFDAIDMDTNKSIKQVQHEINIILKTLIPPLTSITAITINHTFGHCYDNQTRAFIEGFIDSQLTLKSLRQTVPNLKSLCFVDLNADMSRYCLFQQIACILLNCISNQLTSLHIDDRLTAFQDWQLIKNDFKYTKKYNKQPWMPINLKELCLHNNNNMKRHFWFQVSSTLFPNLQSLKITNIVNNHLIEQLFQNQQNIDTITNNMRTLIDNNLIALQFTFTKLELRDIMSDIEADHFHTDRYRVFSLRQFFLLITNIFGNTTTTIKDKQFTLKMCFNVDVVDLDEDEVEKLEQEQIWKAITNQAVMLFMKIQSCYDNVMLGLKLQFQMFTYEIPKSLYYIKASFDNIIKNDTFLKNNKNTWYVDSNAAIIQYNGDTQVQFAATWKTIGGDSPTNSEPYAKYPCQYCEAVSWT